MTPLSEEDVQDMVGTLLLVDSSADPLIPKESPLAISFSRFADSHPDHVGPILGDNVLATVHLTSDGQLVLRNQHSLNDCPLYKERQLQPA